MKLVTLETTILGAIDTSSSPFETNIWRNHISCTKWSCTLKEINNFNDLQKNNQNSIYKKHGKLKAP